ncbi:hypothetical protein [Demequina sp. SO4-18]|uniref:hypothetical protein n=1 Tax=Demequina sp. SO4-18 TaxID=3401026 RepID=UPI003B5AE203
MGTKQTAGALVAAAALMVSGCASEGGVSGPVAWDEELDLGAPGAELDTVDDVGFYPACGNETLTFEGEDWYPFEPANLDDYPSAPLALASAALGFARASAVVALPSVEEPGPGDATGTLTRYDDGFAHWVSDSGNFETWLTATELEYSWVC